MVKVVRNKEVYLGSKIDHTKKKSDVEENCK